MSDHAGLTAPNHIRVPDGHQPVAIVTLDPQKNYRVIGGLPPDQLAQVLSSLAAGLADQLESRVAGVEAMLARAMLFSAVALFGNCKPKPEPLIVVPEGGLQ